VSGTTSTAKDGPSRSCARSRQAPTGLPALPSEKPQAIAEFRNIQPRHCGGRFMVKSLVTSCRSSADKIATVSHLPSMYVLASS